MTNALHIYIYILYKYIYIYILNIYIHMYMYMMTYLAMSTVCVDFVGRFSACYGDRSREWFSNLRFGVTLILSLIAGFWHKLSILSTTREHATKISEVSFAADCQTNIVKCGLCCKRKLWSKNNSTSLWLYLNQQSALVKEIFRSSEFLKLCHLGRYEWCKVNFCISLVSVSLTRQSRNQGGLLLLRHWRNQRNRMILVRL